MLYSYELFVPKVCCHFRVFAPARKEPRRPLKSEIEKRKKIEKREKEKNKDKGGTLLSFIHTCAHV